MPIGFANLGASANPDINNGGNQAVYSGTSWTPPKDGLILCFVGNWVATSSAIPTMSGNRIDWVRIATAVADPGTAHRITLFGGIPTGSVTGFTGFSLGAEAQIGGNASFFHVTGSVDLTGGVTGSIVQTQTNNGTATSGSVTLSAAGNAANRPVACFSHQAQEATTPDPAWEEVDDNSGAGPARGFETQWDVDGFQNASAAWASSSAWIGMAAEIKALVQAQSYDDSVSLERKGLVSDQGSLDIQTSSVFNRSDGMSDGSANSILNDLSILEIESMDSSLLVGIGGEVQFSKIIALLSQNIADMQGSVSTPLTLGADPSGNLIVPSDSSLAKKMSLDLNGGLSFISSMSLSKALSLAASAGLGVFSSLDFGSGMGFVAINTASLGADVGISDSLGMGGSSDLSAQVQASLRKILGIESSAGFSFQGLVDLARVMGKTYSATTSVQAFINISRNIIVLFDADVTTNAVLVILETLSESLGISSSAQLDARPSVEIGKNVSFLSGNTAIMDVGSGMGIIYSVVTAGDTNVIIIKGFIFTSDFASSPITASNFSASALTSDRENGDIETSET